MELVEFQRIAGAALQREGLGDWRIDFHPFDMPAGQCQWTWKVLSFSTAWVTKMPDDRVIETMFHEIAHAKTSLPPTTPLHQIPLEFRMTGGHTPAWENECRRLGVRANHNIPDDDIVIFLGGKLEGVLTCKDFWFEKIYFKHKEVKERETRKSFGAIRTGARWCGGRVFIHAARWIRSLTNHSLVA